MAGRRWPALLLALFAGFAACAGPGQDRSAHGEQQWRGPRVWEAMLPGPGIGAGACESGGVRRPALGCLGKFALFAGPLPQVEGRVQLDIEVPEKLDGRHALVSVEILRATGSWAGEAVETFLLAPGAERITYSLAAGKDAGASVEVKATEVLLPAARIESRSAPLLVPAGAEFVVHLGVEDAVAAHDPAPTHFQVWAAGEGWERPVLDVVLDPAQVSGWVEHRADLGDFAGEEVAFRFAATPLTTASRPFSAPLFGAPLLRARREAPARPSVVLVSLDTLRGDHVGIEQDGRRLTPNLDSLGAQGAVFTQAMTTYSSTTAAHTSMLSGLYPARHGTLHAGMAIPSRVSLAAERFRAAGYATGAVTENAMLSVLAGFGRGFDFYREQRSTGRRLRPGMIEGTLSDALAWARGRAAVDEPFFLFVHTYEVHAPYVPPAQWDVFQPLSAESDPLDRTPAILRAYARYLGEVLYTDSEIGKFLRTLDEEGITEDALVIITSDHGEEFGEHDRRGHSRLPREAVMHVPLLMRGPGVPPGRRLEGVVSLVDVLPTMLQLAGLPAVAGIDGISLVDDLQGVPRPSPRTVFAENRGKGEGIAARTDTRLFLGVGENAAALSAFDLRTDPAGLRPLEDPAALDEAREQIAVYRRLREQGREAAGSEPASVAVDAETAAKLRALGYTD